MPDGVGEAGADDEPEAPARAAQTAQPAQTKASSSLGDMNFDDLLPPEDPDPESEQQSPAFSAPRSISGAGSGDRPAGFDDRLSFDKQPSFDDRPAGFGDRPSGFDDRSSFGGRVSDSQPGFPSASRPAPAFPLEPEPQAPAFPVPPSMSELSFDTPQAAPPSPPAPAPTPGPAPAPQPSVPGSGSAPGFPAPPVPNIGGMGISVSGGPAQPVPGPTPAEVAANSQSLRIRLMRPDGKPFDGPEITTGPKDGDSAENQLRAGAGAQRGPKKQAPKVVVKAGPMARVGHALAVLAISAIGIVPLAYLLLQSVHDREDKLAAQITVPTKMNVLDGTSDAYLGGMAVVLLIVGLLYWTRLKRRRTR